jgi:hypothetical protein
MPDCTDNRKHRSRLPRLAPVLVAVAALTLVAVPSVARADGDPASDVLATQPLFLPQDAGIPIAQQGQVSALLRASGSSGYPIRVALIATRSDLGSVTELWRRPQSYAQFLGQELSLVYRGPLLVVMPTGLGLYAPGSDVAAERSVLASVRIPPGGAGLATAASSAVQRLAAAGGHSVAIPAPHAGAGQAGSTDTMAIVALAIGAALIVLAWALSLRARPPEWRTPRRSRARPS